MNELNVIPQIVWSPQSLFYVTDLPCELGPNGEDINANYRWFQLLFCYFFSPDPENSRATNKTQFLESIQSWLNRQGIVLDRYRLERDLSVVQVTLVSNNKSSTTPVAEIIKARLMQIQQKRKPKYKVVLTKGQYTELIRHIEGVEA